MIFVYTTCEKNEDAKELARLIVKNSIGACVDYWPINSVYRWEGEVKEGSEMMIMISTFESKIDAVTDLICSNHSYSTPMIAGVPVKRINRAYKEWVNEEMKY